MRARLVAVLAAALGVAVLPAEARGDVIAAGIQFIPPWMSSTDPNQSVVVLRSPHLIFNDGSTEPLKVMSAYGGPITSLAPTLGAPLSVVVRGGYAYSSSSCTVFRSTLDGASVTVLARKPACSDGRIAVDDVNVYYTTYVAGPGTWTIHKVPVGGGSAAALVSTSKSIRGLASDGTNVYWTEELYDPDGARSSVRKIPVAGGAPADLATGLKGLQGGLVLDGGELFFADANFWDTYRVFKVSTSGGAAATLATVTSADAPAGIAVDSSNVYWTVEGAVERVPRGGGVVTTLIGGLDSPAGIAVGSGRVFWTETFCCAVHENGFLKSAPTAGGLVSTIADSLTGPGDVAVDSTRVYWVESGGGGSRDGRIRAAPLGGGAIRSIADAGPNALPAFAADDENVYFDTLGTIKKVPLGGGAVEQLTPLGGVYADQEVWAPAQRIVTDGAYVYWIGGSSLSKVARVPVDGGAPEVLWTGYGPPGALAVDDASVYWVDHEDTILKAPKSGGPTVTLASAPLPSFTELVTDGTSLFFVEHDGHIRRMSVDGGPISDFGVAQSMSRLALDQQNLYWIGQGTLGRVSRLDGTSNLVASGLQFSTSVPNGVGADGRGGVYWTETPRGTISTSGPPAAGSADLSITKTDGRATAVPGEPVTYTIVVSNAGPAPASGATVVDGALSPALSGVTWTCVASAGSSCAAASGSGRIDEGIDLLVGGSATFTATGTLDVSLSGTLTNTAAVFPPAGFFDPNPANDRATDVDVILSGADLSITKTDGVTRVAPGQPVVYTIVVSNAGPMAARGAAVSDPVPASLLSPAWTCVAEGGASCTASGSGDIADSADLPVGGSVTYTLSGTLDSDPPGLSNTATVTPPLGLGDPDPADNAATDTDAIVNPTDFYTLTPCRVVDTRRPAGPTGGPELGAGATRTFPLAGACGIPSTARAVSANLTAVQPAAQGYLTLYRSDIGTPPLVSSVNFTVGVTRANNAIVLLAPDGTIGVKNASAGTVHLVLDVNGYFQ